MNKLFTFAKIALIPVFLLGCSGKVDYKKDSGTSERNESVIRTASSNLDVLEEIYDNMDYETVINRFIDKVSSFSTITRFRYYVIFSDLDENTTYSLIDKDIRHTIDAMTKHYVSVLPGEVTPIFLFKDFENYSDFSVNTAGISENDLSPFGYFKISKNMIVIRYVSWKGSTSHEITHTLVRNDFPEIPSWFDEGLASLHEKYIYKNDEMRGDFSWRIHALIRAFQNKTYTTLDKLMESGDAELYGSRSSFYYAQSRYMLMYVQQKNLLDDYYKLFRDTYYEDNTGITQLEKTMNKTLWEIDKELIEYLYSFTLQQ